MLLAFWHYVLYQPLFNGLIWIYNNWTDQNLGWAVVILTIILRVVLLPFTLVTEKARLKQDEIQKDVMGLHKSFRNDPVMKKEEVKKLFKEKKVRPWSKAIVLGVQVLVLVLLYQVFLRGITGEKVLKILYYSINFPGKINTNFYSFELGLNHDWFWAGLVALMLLVEIYIGYRKKKGVITHADLAYFICFPAFTFLALWLLPMVKSLFILTSMIFSVIIHQFSRIIFKAPDSKKTL